MMFKVKEVHSQTHRIKVGNINKRGGGGIYIADKIDLYLKPVFHPKIMTRHRTETRTRVESNIDSNMTRTRIFPARKCPDPN